MSKQNEPAPVTLMPVPQGYAEWLAELKWQIHQAQQRATLAINRELVLLYWRIGRDILTRQSEQGWGAKVIERLAHDLRTAFPDMKGFSPRNLKYMRAFAQAWPDVQFVQQAAAQLPWFHLCTVELAGRIGRGVVGMTSRFDQANNFASTYKSGESRSLPEPAL